MNTNGSSHHAAEASADPPLNRQQQRAADAAARKAKREAQKQASAAEKPKELAPFSVEWLDASIAAQQQLVNQRYADWQQSLGALTAMQAMRTLALQQHEPD